MPILPARHHPLSCGVVTTPATIAFAKKTIAKESFKLVVVPETRPTSASFSAVATAVADRVVLRSTTFSYVQDALANAVKANGYFGSNAFASETPGVVIGSAEGESPYRFTYVASGTARVRATATNGLTQIAAANVTAGGSTTTDAWNSWAVGSLGRHIVESFAALAVPGKTLDMFSIKNHTDAPFTYVRNDACWLFGVDTSCISPWNSLGGQTRAGTLITPLHAVFADHFPVTVGTTVRFVNQPPNATGSLSFEDRTVESVASIPSLDIQVARLSSSVAMPFCKVMPTNSVAYLPSVRQSKNNDFLPLGIPRLPIVATNQDKHVGYKSCFEINNGWGTWYSGVSVNGSATLAEYANFRPTVRIGCSGHPVFCLINGELALLGLYYSANGGTSFCQQATHTAVNQALTTLGGGYQLTAANLSGFTSFA